MLFWLWTIYLFVCTGHVAYLDIRTQCIPNRYLGGYAIGLLALIGYTPSARGHWWSILVATLLVMVVGSIVYLVASTYLGGGDIKYAMVLSLALGLSGTLYMFVLASWLALIAVIVRRVGWQVRVGEPLAFAPYMSLSAMLVWLLPVFQS
jgi:leader peptidase (prepilin peptidase)/N-methyltransferase